VFIYCVDADSLSEMSRLRRDVLPSLWTTLEQLIADGRLLVPHEVVRELSRRYPETAAWLEQHGASVELDNDQISIVRKIRKRVALTDVDQSEPSGDELVVALALARQPAQIAFETDSYVVVTQETRSTTGRRKIPNACDAFGVECIKLMDMFAREGVRL
jgi:hypothetical protein